MAISQKRSRLKPSGSRYIAFRKKKQNELGNRPVMTKISAVKKKPMRKLGGSIKYALVATDVANVLDQKTKKFSKAKIKTVVESKANKNYIRRNIMVKGSVIETDLGKARITSRPGQDGVINAVLI